MHGNRERSMRLIAASIPLQILITGAAAMLLGSLASHSPAPQQPAGVGTTAPAPAITTTQPPAAHCWYGDSQGYWASERDGQSYWVAPPSTTFCAPS